MYTIDQIKIMVLSREPDSTKRHLYVVCIPEDAEADIVEWPTDSIGGPLRSKIVINGARNGLPMVLGMFTLFDRPKLEIVPISELTKDDLVALVVQKAEAFHAR